MYETHLNIHTVDFISCFCNVIVRFQISNIINVEVPVLDFEASVNDGSIINVNLNANDDFCIGEYLNRLTDMRMKHDDKDEVFRILSAITKQTCKISSRLIEENNGMDSLHAVNAACDYICSEIDAVKSRYRRRKKMSSNPLYVHPSERAVGVRVEMLVDKSTGNTMPSLIQCSLQQISLIDTLKSFFACPENRRIYFQHQEFHDCDENIYGCFRCGDLFKNSRFFQENPKAIQLEIATDDFEPCNALGSKSNMHKLTAVYMIIKNLPSKYLSRLQNIYLIALCHADDLKSKTTDFNNILELVVSEAKYLEETGIILDDGQRLRGTVVNLMADNMGYNLALSLAGHSASYFCRICELSKETCQQRTTEILSAYRSNESYQGHLNVISTSDRKKIQLRDTHGVVRYCKLNDLNYFGIFKNISVDIMHDLTEGIVPLVLKTLFEFCFDANIFKLEELKTMCNYYSYPKQFQQSKPSSIVMTRQHLGQNSSQTKCLLLNLPFILYKYRNNNAFRKVWICVQQLIRIFQMVHTLKFKKSKLNELKNLISDFLNNVKEIFKIALTPKLHYLTHYATILERMGSLALLSMMRFEAKHKELKKIAQRTNNFKNINKTIAISHQESMCIKGNNLEDVRLITKREKIDVDFLTKFVDMIYINVQNENEIFTIRCMMYNSFTFKRDKVFTSQSTLYKIVLVLEIDSIIYFAAEKLQMLGIDDFSQSIMIKWGSNQQLDLIKFESIEHKKSYPIKSIEDENFVIIDDLELVYDL